MKTPAAQNASVNKKPKSKLIKWIVIGAVGATRMHILTQFLCEACILSVLGGVIGLLLSFGAVTIYQAAASAAVTMNWGVGFAAIGFCAVIGVLFGGYPAAKASRLQPIEALRAE